MPPSLSPCPTCARPMARHRQVCAYCEQVGVVVPPPARGFRSGELATAAKRRKALAIAICLAAFIPPLGLVLGLKCILGGNPAQKQDALLYLGGAAVGTALSILAFGLTHASRL